MRDVETGQLDATIQDVPIIQYYVDQQKRYPQLVRVGAPVAPGYYVIYAQQQDADLIARINAALQQLYHNGTLRAIYEKYGIWNRSQESLPAVWADWAKRSESKRISAADAIRRYLPLLLKAGGTTVLLAVCAMPLAILMGLTVTLLRCQGEGTALPALVPTGGVPAWLFRAPFTLYVELVRGTPLVFQLYFVYFVLPAIGLRIEPFWAGVLGLAINYSAYEAEIFRLGIQAIPKGQLEAALALGMSPWLAVRRVILPQAVRLVIPATANDFIALFKDTAVCSVITVVELSKQYYIAVQDTGRLIELVVLTSLLYLAMSYPLSLVARWLELRLAPEGRH